MLIRVSRFLALVGLALLFATPADAFGRRASSCAPVYYDYCPCPPAHPYPIGIDCVENTTDKTLRVHVTSGYGSVQGILPPGYKMYFRYYKDGKNRVATAFTLQNDLVDNADFSMLDALVTPNHACWPIMQTQAAATKGARKRGVHEGHGVSPVPHPTNAPI